MPHPIRATIRHEDDAIIDERYLEEWMTSGRKRCNRRDSYDFFLRPDFFFVTFAPRLRACDNPMAIACFLLFTFLPDRPLLSVPALRFFMARPTFFAAPLEYLRFLAFFAIRTFS